MRKLTKKSNNFVVTLILLVTIIFSFTISKVNLLAKEPSTTLTSSVSEIIDSANIFTDKDEENLLSEAINFFDQTGFNIVVLTVPDVFSFKEGVEKFEGTDKTNFEFYSENVFKKMGLDNSTILISVFTSKDDRFVQLFFGDNVSTYFPDKVTNKILLDAFGFTSPFDEVYHIIENITIHTVNEFSQNESNNTFFIVLFAFFLVGVAMFIGDDIKKKKRKRKKN